MLPETEPLFCVPLPSGMSRISSMFLHLSIVIPIGVSADLTMEVRPTALIPHELFQVFPEDPQVSCGCCK
jgi:hypothetical protein